MPDPASHLYHVVMRSVGLPGDVVDALVAARRFANRSHAVETALADTVARAARTRLARECAKVNPREEQALAEEGFSGSRDTWPEY